MTDSQAKTKKSELNVRHTFIVAIISAVLGSTSGPYLLDRFLGINPYRTDPFTGTEGRLLKAEVAALKKHVDDHPDVELRADITELKAQSAAAKAEREQILRNQDRILNRLDNVN